MALTHLVQASASSVEASLNEPREDLARAFENLGAPWQDFVTTIYSARATMLGAGIGKRFYPHELRVRIPMTPDLEPEVQVWDAGTVPVWQDGVLEEPKYFSFFQDQPHAAFNPNYRSQWRAHELLHGAVGFFWHPEMTRFEYYVAARINEMLPVVHWYGFDEAGRARCDAHRNQTYLREYCPACERLALPFWRQDPTKRNAIEPFIELARDIMKRESESCARELETGRVHVNRTAHLDPSSDAVGYLRGHWNRCTAWSFGSWAERYLKPQDVFDDCWSLLERSDAVFQALLEGELTYDKAAADRLAEQRRAQDLAYRLLLALEWCEAGTEEKAEALAEPTLQHFEDVVHGDASLRLPEVDGLSGLVPAEILSGLWADGFERNPAAIQQVLEGLNGAFPGHTFEVETAEEFVASPEFARQGRLDARFAKFSKQEALELHAWLNSEPNKDPEADDFAALPESFEDMHPADLRIQHSLLIREFSSNAIRGVEGLEDIDDGTYDVCRIVVSGDVRILILDESMGRVLTDLKAALERQDKDLMRLIEIGFVVWNPKPRRP